MRQTEARRWRRAEGEMGARRRRMRGGHWRRVTHLPGTPEGVEHLFRAIQCEKETSIDKFGLL